MADSPSYLRSLILGPLLCTGVLVAMSFENRSYRTEADFEPYHTRANAAIDSIPYVIAPWMGQEEPLNAEERRLLKPNAYRCIKFSDTRAVALADPSRMVLLMVAQTRRANDMDGHFPPVCYPSRGYSLVGNEGTPRDWQVADKKIQGMEYQFERRVGTRLERTTVYNFMILPQQGIRRDMKAITASAEDYQQRYYGAAQFQVVFVLSLAEPSQAAREQRDQIFSELIAPCLGVIDTLSKGAIEP